MNSRGWNWGGTRKKLPYFSYLPASVVCQGQVTPPCMGLGAGLSLPRYDTQVCRLFLSWKQVKSNTLRKSCFLPALFLSYEIQIEKPLSGRETGHLRICELSGEDREDLSKDPFTGSPVVPLSPNGLQEFVYQMFPLSHPPLNCLLPPPVQNDTYTSFCLTVLGIFTLVWIPHVNTKILFSPVNLLYVGWII